MPTRKDERCVAVDCFEHATRVVLYHPRCAPKSRYASKVCDYHGDALVETPLAVTVLSDRRIRV